MLPESNASRRGTIAACERSLKRLKTGYLDCYLLHWRGSFPLEDTVAAFDSGIDRGRKNPLLGREQFSMPTISMNCAMSPTMAASPVIRCSIICGNGRSSAAVIPWCERHGVAVVAYSPFGHDDFDRRAVGTAKC